VQVDPIQPTLKAPATKRLQLKCDEPLSNLAFNFNLCYYHKTATGRRVTFEYTLLAGENDSPEQARALGRAVRVDPMNPHRQRQHLSS
jgi:adenine C2-methylase RlmN of 23S rRNA A2503 and tRNA A37